MSSDRVRGDELADEDSATEKALVRKFQRELEEISDTIHLYGFVRHKKPESREGRRIARARMLSDVIRGQFLEMVSWIDWEIDEAIAWHLCPDVERQATLRSLVLGNQEVMTFSRRISILKRLLKVEYPYLYSKYVQVFRELANIRDVRNKLAHGRLDPSATHLHGVHENRVRYIYIHNGSDEVYETTLAEHERLISLGLNTIVLLDRLARSIAFSWPPS